MTPAQKIIYDLVLKFWADNKYSPSYRELAKATGKSATHVYRTVKRLANLGPLHVVKGRSRGIYPIHEWRALTGPGDHNELYNELMKENRRMRLALEEISAVAEHSESGEFYVMLAEGGLLTES
tara:strand:- start:4826 stop:5197 length:372 start_codon:yes stop_codon:yes gene_type:complete